MHVINFPKKTRNKILKKGKNSSINRKKNNPPKLERRFECCKNCRYDRKNSLTHSSTIHVVAYGITSIKKHEHSSDELL